MQRFPQQLSIIALTLFMLMFPGACFAADTTSLTITVTPPLFQVTQAPGTDWHSQLRVVNSNNYDITVRVGAQDFHPDGETGNAVLEEGSKADPSDSRRMSGWIEVPPGDLIIKRGSTAEVPFTLHVPVNADPGGHYGGLLVSTRPGDLVGGSGAGISSGISSLIFLRVPGDVVEKGSIRDFYTEHNVIQSPDAHFILRFENEGNVHLVPQGEILITNMWGKERGKVNINESSTFGNVLPSSTRKFEFAWNEIDPSPLEVGRYKAVATIVYGTEGRQTVLRTVYFWIVPLKPVATIFGSLFFFIWFISWSIRRYIKKALRMERARLGMNEEEFVTHRKGATSPQIAQPPLTFTALKQPLREASLELSRAKRAERGSSERAYAAKPETKKTKSQVTLLRAYRPVIVFTFVLLTGISLITWYFVEVFQDERAYHVEQIRPR